MPRALTSISVENIKPVPGKRVELPDPALTGLYLVIQPSGAKSWAVRYRHDGKPRKLTLGKWPVTGVASARLLASEALEEVARGRDPCRQKKVEKAARRLRGDRDSIEALFEAYTRRHLSGLKSGAVVRREIERHALAAWRGRTIQSIERRDILELLDSVLDSGRATTSNRLRAYLSRFFNWCIERDVIGTSPMAGVKAPAKEISRDRVLSDSEIRWFWSACDDVGHPWGPVGKLLLLTGQRLGEVARMTEDEIAGDTWQLPAGRTKNGRAHDVPLSDGARDVLAGVERIRNATGYVFTTNGETPVSGFHRARNIIAKRMTEVAEAELGEPHEIPHWTFHDLRRTAATGLARLGIPVRVTEAVLNHVSGTGGGIVAVYQRHDYGEEKCHALQAWSDEVMISLEVATFADTGALDSP